VGPPDPYGQPSGGFPPPGRPGQPSQFPPGQPGQPGPYPPPGQAPYGQQPNVQPGAEQYGQQPFAQPGAEQQYAQQTPGQYAQPAPGVPGQYGQQVPGQYGQPVPGPYGPPPGTPYGQPGQFPPAPMAPKSKFRFLRLGIVLVVVVAAVVIGIVSYSSSPESSSVGDCLKVAEFTDGVTPDKVDCNDAAANVKIGARLANASDKCPEGMYDEYEVTGRSDYRLCLVINAKQGDCLKGFQSQTAGYQKVPCSDPGKDAELVKVVDGQEGEAVCQGTDATEYRSYSQPKLTLCIKS
jgi:hypothetical protein